MTYNDMRPGIRYIVTKASRHKEFQVGDRIGFDIKNTSTILNFDVCGWIDKDEIQAATEGMECEIDQKWLARRKQKLQAELEALK